VAAPLPAASPGKLSARTSRRDHLARRGNHGSRARPGRRAAANGAQIHREEMRRLHLRLPTGNPIPIGAGGAGAVAEAADRGLVIRPARALVRGPAEGAQSAEFAGIEWTSGALA